MLSECSYYSLIIKGNTRRKTITKHPSLLDDNSAVEPPEPISNSEVKRSSANGSVGLPHVRVGHRQVLIQTLAEQSARVFLFLAFRKFTREKFIGIKKPRIARLF